MLPVALNLFEAHLTVADLDASVAFYRDVVRLQPAHIPTGNQVAFFWVGQRGHAMLGLWAAGPAPLRTTMHFAFGASVEEVVAAPPALRAAGVVPLDFEGRPTGEPVVLAWMP